MKIYSYQENNQIFLELKEISIVGNVDELVAIISLLKQAVKLKNEGNYYSDHLHLKDEWESWRNSSSDIVILLNDIK